MDFVTRASTSKCRCSVRRQEKYDSALSSMRVLKNSLVSASIFAFVSASDSVGRAACSEPAPPVTQPFFWARFSLEN
jgi:hypothetical protein